MAAKGLRDNHNHRKVDFFTNTYYIIRKEAHRATNVALITISPSLDFEIAINNFVIQEIYVSYILLKLIQSSSQNYYFEKTISM